MRFEGKSIYINIAVMAGILCAGTVVVSARSGWNAPLISFGENQDLKSHPKKEVSLMGEPRTEEVLYYDTPTPVPTPPWEDPGYNPGSCPCAPPATPVPTPVDTDVPPAPTPTPDTSGATGPFTVTVNSFL